MTTTSRLLAAGAVWLAALTLHAAEDEPVVVTTTSQQLGIGPTQLLDTYLSQEKFTGMGLTYLSTSDRHTGRPDKGHWHTLVQHQTSLATAEDRAQMREELEGDYSLFVGRQYGGRVAAWGQHNSLALMAGAYLNGNIGFIYNTSNSNNPAQARLSLQLMPTGTAVWQSRLFKRQLLVRYGLALPLAGLAFSPNYGQSYYELFSLGNYDRNIVPTTLVSAPNVRQQLAVEYKLWKKSRLLVGYLGDYQQLQVNHLKSHVYHHRVMVGVVKDIETVRK